MSKPWRTVDTVATAEGALELRQRDERDFLIVIGGRVLMTSTARRSEEELAKLAAGAVPGRPRASVLIGGLGMGYTLRAALDAFGPGARISVAELTPTVVDWCRGPLALLTNDAAGDPRVTIVVADVAKVIAAGPARFDAILLDLYEGPNASTQHKNDPFYGLHALQRSHAALRPGGVLAVWAEDPDVEFQRRFAATGFTVTTHRAGRGGRSHIVYLGVRAATGSR